jgi:hypothetical protein
MTASPSYRELQVFPRPWLLALLGAIALFLAVVAPLSILSWALRGVVAAFLSSLRLRTEVRDDGVFVKLRPIHRSFRHPGPPAHR